MLAAKQIVCAHDGQHARFLNGRAKCRQINLPQRPLIHLHVDRTALDFLIVHREMFRASGDPLRLLALDVIDAMRAVRNGSSPMYSKFRPQSGVRWMFRLGPSMMFLLRCFASCPMTVPYAVARSVLKVAARPMVAGMAVAKSSSRLRLRKPSPTSSRTPIGPSSIHNSGMPRRGTLSVAKVDLA